MVRWRPDGRAPRSDRGATASGQSRPVGREGTRLLDEQHQRCGRRAGILVDGRDHEVERLSIGLDLALEHLAVVRTPSGARRSPARTRRPRRRRPRSRAPAAATRLGIAGRGGERVGGIPRQGLVGEVAQTEVEMAVADRDADASPPPAGPLVMPEASVRAMVVTVTPFTSSVLISTGDGSAVAEIARTSVSRESTRCWPTVASRDRGDEAHRRGRRHRSDAPIAMSSTQSR